MNNVSLVVANYKKKISTVYEKCYRAFFHGVKIPDKEDDKRPWFRKIAWTAEVAWLHRDLKWCYDMQKGRLHMYPKKEYLKNPNFEQKEKSGKPVFVVDVTEDPDPDPESDTDTEDEGNGVAKLASRHKRGKRQWSQFHVDSFEKWWPKHEGRFSNANIVNRSLENWKKLPCDKKKPFRKYFNEFMKDIFPTAYKSSYEIMQKLKEGRLMSWHAAWTLQCDKIKKQQNKK